MDLAKMNATVKVLIGCLREEVIMILEFLKMRITRALYLLHARPVTICDHKGCLI
jgi:hypothetical protein